MPLDMGTIRFTDFFHDEAIRREIYGMDAVVESELLGLLGTYDADLKGAERDRQISERVDMTILAYLIRTRGEQEVWDYLQTLRYPYDANWSSHAPAKQLFPSGEVRTMMLEAFPDVAECDKQSARKGCRKPVRLVGQGGGASCLTPIPINRYCLGA